VQGEKISFEMKLNVEKPHDQILDLSMFLVSTFPKSPYLYVISLRYNLFLNLKQYFHFIKLLSLNSRINKNVVGETLNADSQ